MFLGTFSVPNILNPVYCTIDYRLQSHAELVILACVGSLKYREIQHLLIRTFVARFPLLPPDVQRVAYLM